MSRTSEKERLQTTWDWSKVIRAMQKVHETSLELLERVGVLVRYQEALRLLGEAGAGVDHNLQRAKIPSYVVEKCIRKAPRTILFAGRNSTDDLRLGLKRDHFGTGGGATRRLFAHTNAIETSTKKDVEEAAKLADALPNLDFVMSLFYSQDVPKQATPLHDLDAMLKRYQRELQTN